MGCDIHAIIERKAEREWLNSGDPDLGRNYELFAALAGVRNRDGIVPVAEPKGIPGFMSFQTFSDGDRWVKWERGSWEFRPCREFERMMEVYGEDGHSGSWLTLAEVKAYDTEQEIVDTRLVLSRDDGGRATALCDWTSGEHLGEVGPTKIFRWPGEDEPTCWLRLIRYMEQAKWDGQSDDEIRLVFFFDN